MRESLAEVYWYTHSARLDIHSEVVKTLHTNAATSKLVTISILDHLHDAIASQALKLNVKGSMEYSIITKKEAWPVESKKMLSYILPEYFSS